MEWVGRDILWPVKSPSQNDDKTWPSRLVSTELPATDIMMTDLRQAPYHLLWRIYKPRPRPTAWYKKQARCKSRSSEKGSSKSGGNSSNSHCSVTASKPRPAVHSNNAFVQSRMARNSPSLTRRRAKVCNSFTFLSNWAVEYANTAVTGRNLSDSEPPQPAAVALACNTELPTEEQPPALTPTLNETTHDATNTQTDNTSMMDGRDLDGNIALSSDQVSGIGNDVSTRVVGL